MSLSHLTFKIEDDLNKPVIWSRPYLLLFLKGLWRYRIMTLQVFSRDAVPLLQLGMMFIGLISLFLLLYQIRQTNLWNKLRSEHNFNQPSHLKVNKQLLEAAKEAGVDLNGRLTAINDDELKKIVGSDETFYLLTMCLCDFKNICAAINIGAADKDLTYATHSHRSVSTYKAYKPVIDFLRKRDKDDEIYIELEKVALEFEEKHIQSVGSQKLAVKKLETQLEKTKGVGKKV